MLNALTNSLICICFIHHLGCMQRGAQTRDYGCNFSQIVLHNIAFGMYVRFTVVISCECVSIKGLKGAIREGSDQVMEGQSCAYLVSFMLQSGARIRCFT